MEIMTYVTVEYEIMKNRKLLHVLRGFDISDELWDSLRVFAVVDGFSYINEDMMQVVRSWNLDNVINFNMNGFSDEKFRDEIQSVPYHYNIFIRPMKYKYEYSKKIISVDLENQVGYVEKSMSFKDIQDYMDSHHGLPPKPVIYEVKLSDKCIYQGVKGEDTVLIRKLLNDSLLAVEVLESYQEVTDEEVERQLQELEDLGWDV